MRVTIDNDSFPTVLLLSLQNRLLAVKNTGGFVFLLILSACVPVSISPLFPPSVQYWANDIVAWSGEDIPPNFLATIMAMETCGDPNIPSSKGAVGLFQLIPQFHQQPGDDLWDPATNALRSTEYITRYCARRESSVTLVYDYITFACYNGGPNRINEPPDNWANETQRFAQLSSILYESVQRHDTILYKQWWQEKSQVCARSERRLATRQ